MPNRNNFSASMQREGCPQEPELFVAAFGLLVVRSKDATQERQQNAAHAAERDQDPFSCECHGPAALEDTSCKPPRCHVSDDLTRSKSRKELGHCEDTFPDEDWAPNREGPTCWGHQGLILLAQGRVSLSEDTWRTTTHC